MFINTHRLLIKLMSVNSTMQEEKQPKGMQFVTKISKMGEYLYLRIPRERSESAEKYREKYLLVRFHQVTEGDTET